MILYQITKEQGGNLAQLKENYLVFLDGVCDRADPAAVFEALLVLPSRSTLDAADAARLDVCFEFLAISITSLHFGVTDRTSVP